MIAEEITVRVSPDVAKWYRSASEEERRKLDLLVSLRLRDATAGESLDKVLADMSRKARERGLTEDMLVTPSRFLYQDS
jgi:hypothetical protein